MVARWHHPWSFHDSPCSSPVKPRNGSYSDFDAPRPRRAALAAQALLAKRRAVNVLVHVGLALAIAWQFAPRWQLRLHGSPESRAWLLPVRAPRVASKLPRQSSDSDIEEAESLLVEEANADGDAEYVERTRVHDLEVGQELAGIVQSIQSYGVFVDVGADVDGLVHISRLKEGFVENIDDVVQPGQEVKVWISSISEDGKLGLSMVKSRASAGSPKTARSAPGPKDIKAFADVDPDQWLSAKVTGIVEFGAFVEVSPPEGGEPVQGLVHITQMSDGFVERPSDIVDIDQEVKVRVINVDTYSGRLSFSMKEPSEDALPQKRPPSPDVSAFDGASPTEWFTGKVHHTATFGIFVDVTPPGGGDTVRGLVHVTQIKEDFVDDPAAEVDVGQEVRVRVVNVDTLLGRLALSMREAPTE